MTVTLSSFGDRLRAERTRLGYSLRSLATATGAFGDRAPYTPPEVARWHHAQHGPRGDVLARLCRLSFDLPFLLTGRADHAHHLAPTDGLGEARVPLAALYGPDGAPHWPTPITWTAPEALAAASLHMRASGGRVLRTEALAHAFATCVVARAWATWRPDTPGTERRVAALATAWSTAFNLAACVASPLPREELVTAAVHALSAQHAASRAPRAA